MSSKSYGGTAAAAMLLRQCWGYLLTLTEKLHLELSAYSEGGSGSTSGSNSTSNSSRSSNTMPPSCRRRARPGLKGDEQPVCCPPKREQRQQQEQQQQQQQQQERAAQKEERDNHTEECATTSNKLEFSLTDLFRKLFFSSRPLPAANFSSTTSRAPVYTAPSTPSDIGPSAAVAAAAAAAAERRGATSLCWRSGSSSGSSSSSSSSRSRGKVSSKSGGPGLLPAATAPSMKTLVLDLDETLIHARDDPRDMGESRFDFMLVFETQQQQHNNSNNNLLGPLPGKERRRTRQAAATAGVSETSYRRMYVRKRPHLKDFLETVSEMFEVVLFTAAPEEYAKAVLRQIDPEGKLVDHVISRETCTRSELGHRWRSSGSSTFSVSGSSGSSSSRGRCGGVKWGGWNGSSGGDGRKNRCPTPSVVKDIRIIGRPLSKVIMVETSMDAIRYHLENGLHIPIFCGDRTDTELLSTLKALEALAPAEDVRDGIIRISVETQARKEGHVLMPDGSISPTS